MAFVHVLQNAGGDNFTAIAHVATPVGNNFFGTPWKTCWLVSFGASTPKSRLIVGNGPGQISQSESNQISGGDLMEIEFIFTDDVALNAADRNSMIDYVANQTITQRLAEFRQMFKLYGYTRP